MSCSLSDGDSLKPNMDQMDGNRIRRYKHVFLDAEGTLYVPKGGRSRWEFWASPSPDEAVKFFELDKGVVEALSLLREEVDTLCLVSRNSESILGALLKKFNIDGYFDGIMLNGNKGKQIENYLARHGLRKEDAIMVGDMPSLDLYPVRKAGVDAVLIDRAYNRYARAERIKGVYELPMWLRLASLVERLERQRVRNSTLDEFLHDGKPSTGETKSLIAVAET